MQAIDYRYIVEELKRSLTCPDQAEDRCADDVREKVRSRLVYMLDVDPELSLEAVIDQLAEKWRRDGLI
jgi:hypothetical protein